ncbi:MULTISPECIES: hypothetical protein [Sphingobacterium]|uniref:hypothetical protein n=1 Tax=Sphingobacterium TaxID=28453 RepID=UPI00104EB928|nr:MULTISPECIES: hypothetical protein [Sphingobacterium]MCW2260124.1 ABC-type glycerol-3-phosphate transport system permease component [Sphingobacterium kitahiroshimense]TCR11085.1 hypothetical protein EDF67_104178 [Sphingobacterium sp. JUb78]
MKIDLVKTIIAVAVSSLIAYGFNMFSVSFNKDLLTFGSLLFLIITLTFTIGIRFDLPRTTSLIRTISIIFFAIAFFSNLTFSFTDFKEASYIIVNGILFLIFVLSVYSINRAKQ